MSQNQSQVSSTLVEMIASDEGLQFDVTLRAQLGSPLGVNLMLGAALVGEALPERMTRDEWYNTKAQQRGVCMNCRAVSGATLDDARTPQGWQWRGIGTSRGADQVWFLFCSEGCRMAFFREYESRLGDLFEDMKTLIKLGAI